MHKLHVYVEISWLTCNTTRKINKSKMKDNNVTYNTTMEINKSTMKDNKKRTSS